METQPELRSHAPVLSKSDINLLPLKKYEGPVEVIASDERLRAVMPELHGERVLGFDIEVRPTFKVGDHFPPALVQLAGKNRVFLVQLKRIRDLGALAALFADARVIKTGVAVSGDIEKLHEIMRFTAAGFIDLGRMAARKGFKAMGVRTLAAQLLGFRISKGAQCSNWERSDLAPAQVLYAATDAWVCREIFLFLEKMPDIKAKTNPKESVSVSVSVSKKTNEL
ncbi:MAG: 3'-5' exonuclease domain-containing protein 2 [Acidobacteria bacterium]|jgi:ribonuclease D|nr:3'-5' exonuclease domain-containing protein 2 [Acidobacteriota bacterium]